MSDQSALGQLEVLLVTIIGAAVFLFVYVAVVLRQRWRRQKLAEIPRERVPLGHGKGELTKAMYKVIHLEMRRSVQTKAQPLPEMAPRGWGQADSDFATVHFKTSVSKSFLVLQWAAEQKGPSLKRRETETIQDYMVRLQRSCGLPQQLCEWYVDVYQRAQFSPVELTEREYTRFMRNFYYLYQTLLNFSGGETPML